MNYGYIRVFNLKELLEFKARSNVDIIISDLLNLNKTKGSSNVEFEKLMEVVKSGDKIIIKSIENACRISKNFDGVEDLLKLIDTCNKKGVELISEEDENIDVLLTKAGSSMISILRKFITVTINNINTNSKNSRTINYADNFMSVYHNYRTGAISSEVAAEKLGISLGTFYKQVYIFESV